MALPQMAFNPADGLKNTTIYPTVPENETAAREQIQGRLNELKNYINNTLLANLIENGGGMAKISAGLEEDMPDAGNEGDIYIATDEGIIYRDNGVSWDALSADMSALAAHLAETMPHKFIDGDTMYRWGLSVVNGVLTFNYEEVV